MSRFENLEIDSNQSAAELLEFLVKKSIESRASDLHIDPLKDRVRLRLRIDGKLYELPSLQIESSSELISRIKILAMLRIDEHSKAQDGRFRLGLSPTDFVDVRVSILPTYYGENAVLRLLSDNSKSLGLESLGFSQSDLQKIKEAISKDNGMVLITGPTGCGKTTTLYSILQTLNKSETSIITIEEPIEYSIAGIRQIGVNPGSNLNFANGLRSILRQDPNIIMVGEIRDSETASLSVNAALTGHLLLSTLHTNNAASALPRLLDMGVPPFLLASTFSVAVNQRLIKKLCSDCKVEEKIAETQKNYLSELLQENLSSQKFYKGKGCASCHGSGFCGRLAIGEILSVDDSLREAILEKKTAGNIRRLAIKNGMTTLMRNGFNKVKEGIASLEDFFSVAYEP